jgi:DNA modification methylase
MNKNKIYQGDCIEVMRTFPDNSIDTIITDPPYGLEFMGKKWDYDVPAVELWKEALRVLKPGGTALIFAGSRTQHRMAVNVEDAGFILKDCIMWLYGSGFPKATDISKQLDKNNGLDSKKQKELREYIRKCWKESGKTAIEIKIATKDSLKGGGRFSNYVGNVGCVPTMKDWNILKGELSMDDRFDNFIAEAEREITGTRRQRANSSSSKIKMNTSVGDVEEITKPSTPEAKQWSGWKSHGLKPAYEPILVAMKPNDGTYANNALKHGVSGLNIDGGRIEAGEEHIKNCKRSGGKRSGFMVSELKAEAHPQGRFPANIILECLCDEVIEGDEIGNGAYPRLKKEFTGESNITFRGAEEREERQNIKEKAQIHTNPECPAKMLDEQSGESKSIQTKRGDGIGKGFHGSSSEHNTERGHNDKGGASRFFYVAKASKAERNAGCEGLEEKRGGMRNASGRVVGGQKSLDTGDAYSEPRLTKNNHPTVKPLALMEYLCTLTKTPTGGIVLDPFLGSGTTALAAQNTGRSYIGIEKEKEYIRIAEARLAQKTLL